MLYWNEEIINNHNKVSPNIQSSYLNYLLLGFTLCYVLWCKKISICFYILHSFFLNPHKQLYSLGKMFDSVFFPWSYLLYLNEEIINNHNKVSPNIQSSYLNYLLLGFTLCYVLWCKKISICFYILHSFFLNPHKQLGSSRKMFDSVFFLDLVFFIDF